MIVVEDHDSVERRYSDIGVMLRQIETNTLWPDAINAKPCEFTFEETNIPIPDEEIDDEEAIRIVTGGVT